MTIKFTVPGQPIAKGRHRSYIAKKKTGQLFIAHYTPKETKQYEALIELAARQAAGQSNRLATALIVRTDFYFPIPVSRQSGKNRVVEHDRHRQKPDSDNCNKSVLDGMKPIWLDDSLVSDLIITKRWANPSDTRTAVEVTPAGELTHCPYCRREL